MEQAYSTVGTTIVNPGNGPGSASNSDYVEQVKHSQAAGLTVLGYVYTGYGARDIAAVKADIDNHYLWYDVDGIFLDEASTDCSFTSSYYTDLYNYVKAKGGKAVTVVNPGAQTKECYMPVADIIVTFEGAYSTYVSSYSAPSWTDSYPASRFWHLIYDAQSTEAIEEAVSLSKQRGAGWVYVTPDGLPNPWNSLPPDPYWSRLLSAI